MQFTNLEEVEEAARLILPKEVGCTCMLRPSCFCCCLVLMSS